MVRRARGFSGLYIYYSLGINAKCVCVCVIFDWASRESNYNLVPIERWARAFLAANPKNPREREEYFREYIFTENSLWLALGQRELGCDICHR